MARTGRTLTDADVAAIVDRLILELARRGLALRRRTKADLARGPTEEEAAEARRVEKLIEGLPREDLIELARDSAPRGRRSRS